MDYTVFKDLASLLRSFLISSIVEIKKMETTYRPYFDPDYDSLIDRIHPPRVCIDNDTCQDCTLVKVDSANKNGILLEMVQVLTDLDLLISKSYICSDGGWFMDVFHVTDQLGNKVMDESIAHYIERAICASKRGKMEVKTSTLRDVRPHHMSMETTALEMTGEDRPGLMSEISAVLAELGCHVSGAVAWTHNTRVACIIYVEDESKAGPIKDPRRVAHVQAQLDNVIKAHNSEGERRRSVRLAAPDTSQTHTERRLHQLMTADDEDYEECSCSDRECEENGNQRFCRKVGTESMEAKVTIENCKEKRYSIVTVRSRDRPKLLFDTVCTLTDMQYVVFHAAISSKNSFAFQEYYIRHKDGRTLNSRIERQRITRCLVAAVERRVSEGLRVDVCTRNRVGLLSDVTRVFREYGLSILRTEIGVRGERAVGSFYVRDAGGQSVNPEIVEAIRKEIEGTVVVVNQLPLSWSPRTSSSVSRSSSGDDVEEERPRFSLGALFWSQLERLSSNFKPINS